MLGLSIAECASSEPFSFVTNSKPLSICADIKGYFKKEHIPSHYSCSVGRKELDIQCALVKCSNNIARTINNIVIG